MAVIDSRNLTLRADAARNRDRVLEVARAELAEGAATLPLNDIARRAGVGVGTVYRHFPTPQALLEASVQDQLRELVAAAGRALAMSDTRRAVEALLRGWLDAQLASGGLGTVLAAPADDDAATTRGKEELADLTAQLLRRAYRDRVVRRSVTAADLRSLVCGLETAVRTGPQDAKRARRYLTLLLDGLRPTTRG